MRSLNDFTTLDTAPLQSQKHHTYVWKTITNPQSTQYACQCFISLSKDAHQALEGAALASVSSSLGAAVAMVAMVSSSDSDDWRRLRSF